MYVVRRHFMVKRRLSNKIMSVHTVCACVCVFLISKRIQVGIEFKLVKWCEVQWCGVNWDDLCEVILFWSEVSYGEVLGDKSTKYIMVTLCWRFLIVLWLCHLVCILYCGCLNFFCNMWASVCGGGLTVVWVFW